MRVPGGRLVSLLGPNGAGKTTLTRILSTELEPTEGKLTILGVDALRHPERVRSRLALIPQDAKPISFVTPYELTVTYLVMRGYSIGDARREARRALEELDMWDVRDKVFAELSGGYRRRGLVAMVLASNADIVLMDEPTTGLDIFSRRGVWDALMRLKKNSTVILTTHYIEEAEMLSDYVYLINNGSIVTEGAVDELLKLIEGDYVVEAYGIGEGILEGYRYVKVSGDRYVIYLNTEDDAASLARSIVEMGGRAFFRRKNLEDAVIKVTGGWSDHEEPEADDSG